MYVKGSCWCATQEEETPAPLAAKNSVVIRRSAARRGATRCTVNRMTSSLRTKSRAPPPPPPLPSRASLETHKVPLPRRESVSGWDERDTAGVHSPGQGAAELDPPHTAAGKVTTRREQPSTYTGTRVFPASSTSYSFSSFFYLNTPFLYPAFLTPFVHTYIFI